jgi:hypothetical protein
MVQRCTNPAAKDWPDYGGRGITICDRWRESFAAFAADVGARPARAMPARAMLDRVENNRGYEPGNVRWSTPNEQARNRRSTRVIEYQGQRRSMVEWAEATGIPYSTLRTRLRDGWPIERALTELSFVGKNQVHP